MRRLVRAMGCVALVVLAGCWPQPGGNADRTGHNPTETSVTTANVADLEEAWRRQFPQGIVGEPVTSSAGVHLVAWAAGQPTLHALRPGDGTAQWSQPVTEFPSVGLSGPWVIGDRVAVGWYYYRVRPIIVDGGTPTFDAATGEFQGEVGEGTPEAVRGRKVLIKSEAFSDPVTITATYRLQDLDAPGPGPTWSNLGEVTLGAQRLYHDSGQGLAARSLTSPSTVLWSTPLGGWPRAAVLSADESTVYVVAQPDGGDATLHALDAATGAVLWTAPLGGDAPMPALAEGRLHVPVSTGEVLTFDAAGCGAASCEPLWRSSTGAVRTSAGQPAIAGGVVYTTWTDGSVVGFDAAGCATPPCAPLWSGTTGDGAAVGGPIVSNGQVYARTDDHLVAYGLP